MAEDPSAEVNKNKPTNEEDDDDDDDVEDEDYVPQQQQEEEGDEEVLGAEQQTNEPMKTTDAAPFRPLTVSQQQKVDEAFNSLQFVGRHKKRKFENDDMVNDVDEKKKKVVGWRQKEILSEIFGVSVALRMLSDYEVLGEDYDDHEVVVQYPKRKKRRVTIPPSCARSQKDQSIKVSDERLEELLKATKSQIVTEVKKFAGQEVQVERKVDPSSICQEKAAKNLEESNTDNSKSGGGIDKVLQDMKGPQKISTVAKTSTDWDKFKTEKGVGEELEQKAQSKDAYLEKKDFLGRVDVRRFEHEKARRDVERASRGK